MKIQDRFFLDGGLGHNNPSFAILFHYTGGERKKSTRLMAASPASTPQYSPHGDLDCSRVRFTNIGTGAKIDETEPGKREMLAALIPGFIRKVVFVKQTLTEIAVNSEDNADIMRQFQIVNSNTIMYERFNASHGVCNIKLDDHNALGAIRAKTEQYLEEQETKDLLEEVGLAIATDYLNTRSIHGQSVQPADLAVDNSRQALRSSNLMSASAPPSSGPSNHSNPSESESHVLSPSDGNLQNGAPAMLAEHSVEPHFSLDGQEYSKRYANKGSAIDINGPEVTIAAITA